MCNDYRLLVDAASIVEDFADLKITIRFSEGVPNLEAREDIKITDVAPIVRTIEGAARRGRPGAAALELARAEQAAGLQLPLRRSEVRIEPLPDRRGRLLRVHRSEGPEKKRKDKWLFTRKDEPIFCIAGIWRDTADVGEAFTMLTMAPGPDIAPYHDRQIVILERDAWADWLDPSVPAASLIRPLPAGTLLVEQVG